jgi:hypothetical protein
VSYSASAVKIYNALSRLGILKIFIGPRSVYVHSFSSAPGFQAIWNIVTVWVKKNGKYRAQRAKHVVLFHLPGAQICKKRFQRAV